MTDDTTKPWRYIASDLVDAGRCLARIEDALRTIGATAIVDDRHALDALANAYSAARKLVTALDNVRRREQ